MIRPASDAVKSHGRWKILHPFYRSGHQKRPFFGFFFGLFSLSRTSSRGGMLQALPALGTPSVGRAPFLYCLRSSSPHAGGPDPVGPASSEYVPEDLPKRRTKLLNKADGKNRESENPEEISLLSGRNPTVVLEHRGKRFETENRQRGQGGGTSVCEYDRNDKTPKGCPTESYVNGRPPKLADGNMAPAAGLEPATRWLTATCSAN